MSCDSVVDSGPFLSSNVRLYEALAVKAGFDRHIVSPSAIKRFKGPAVTENFIIVGGAL